MTLDFRFQLDYFLETFSTFPMVQCVNNVILLYETKVFQNNAINKVNDGVVSTETRKTIVPLHHTHAYVFYFVT